jgi:hypothetical protein
VTLESAEHPAKQSEQREQTLSTNEGIQMDRGELHLLKFNLNAQSCSDLLLEPDSNTGMRLASD